MSCRVEPVNPTPASTGYQPAVPPITQPPPPPPTSTQPNPGLHREVLIVKTLSAPQPAAHRQLIRAKHLTTGSPTPPTPTIPASISRYRCLNQSLTTRLRWATECGIEGEARSAASRNNAAGEQNCPISSLFYIIIYSSCCPTSRGTSSTRPISTNCCFQSASYTVLSRGPSTKILMLQVMSVERHLHWKETERCRDVIGLPYGRQMSLIGSCYETRPRVVYFDEKLTTLIGLSYDARPIFMKPASALLRNQLCDCDIQHRLTSIPIAYLATGCRWVFNARGDVIFATFSSLFSVSLSLPGSPAVSSPKSRRLRQVQQDRGANHEAHGATEGVLCAPFFCACLSKSCVSLFASAVKNGEEAGVRNFSILVVPTVFVQGPCVADVHHLADNV